MMSRRRSTKCGPSGGKAIRVKTKIANTVRSKTRETLSDGMNITITMTMTMTTTIILTNTITITITSVAIAIE